MMTALTDATFEAVVAGSRRPLLVVFTSRECWICDMFIASLTPALPVISSLGDVATADVTEAPSAAAYYCIAGTPRSLLFRAGEEVSMLRGAWPAEDVVAFITDALQGSTE